MTCRNVLMVLLMILVLPVSGMAQTMTFDTGHAMSPSAMASSDAASELATSEHDCCDPDAFGSVCENGQECKTSSLLQLALGKVVSPALSPRPSALLPGRAPTRAPDVVWHPPRS